MGGQREYTPSVDGLESNPQPAPAGAARRLVAGLIDVAAVLVAGVVFAAAFGSDQPKGTLSMTFNDKVVNDGGVVLFVALVLVAFYVTEAATGRTVGKAMTGLRVTTRDGQRAGAGAILIRTLLRPVDGLPYIVPNLLGFIVLASTEANQRIGDRLAGTIVVAE